MWGGRLVGAQLANNDLGFIWTIDTELILAVLVDSLADHHHEPLWHPLDIISLV
jgi:hypothetical protein